MQTSVTVDNLDFERFDVQEQLNVGIMLKDFKSIAIHAEALKASVTAQYSSPGRPMQLRYIDSGMQCKFTLMTIGRIQGTTSIPGLESRQASAMPLQTPQRSLNDTQSVLPTTERPKISMPPPSEPTSRSVGKNSAPHHGTQRPSPPPPKPSINPESLFLPQYEDEDRHWGESRNNDEEDVLGWSAHPINVCHTHAIFSQVN